MTHFSGSNLKLYLGEMVFVFIGSYVLVTIALYEGVSGLDFCICTIFSSIEETFSLKEVKSLSPVDFICSFRELKAKEGDGLVCSDDTLTGMLRNFSLQVLHM